MKHIKIKGGPYPINLVVTSYDPETNEEILLESITGIEINPIKPGELITANLTFLVSELDIEMTDGSLDE